MSPWLCETVPLALLFGTNAEDYSGDYSDFIRQFKTAFAELNSGEANESAGRTLLSRPTRGGDLKNFESLAPIRTTE